jgi:hypothetical protein
MSPGAHIRTGSRPPGRVRRMSHSKLRQYLFLSDLQTPRGITSSIGLADSCHAWSVQYGRAHYARLTSHPHLCEVSPRSSLRGPQLTGARLRPSVLGWLSPSFGAISCLGRACAADTHIPAPLSSLTPIDPRTLTIIRAFGFCVNRHLRVFYYAKPGTRAIRPLPPLALRGITISRNRKFEGTALLEKATLLFSDRSCKSKSSMPEHSIPTTITLVDRKIFPPTQPFGHAVEGVPRAGPMHRSILRMCVRIKSRSHGESVRRGYTYPGAPLKFDTNRPPYSHHHTCL